MEALQKAVHSGQQAQHNMQQTRMLMKSHGSTSQNQHHAQRYCCIIWLIAALIVGLFAGTNAALRELGGKYIFQANVLIRLVPSFKAALQAYQMRAAQSGQSFERMVLLEAAVQGWYAPIFLVLSLSSTSWACTRPEHIAYAVESPGLTVLPVDTQADARAHCAYHV